MHYFASVFLSNKRNLRHLIQYLDFCVYTKILKITKKFRTFIQHVSQNGNKVSLIKG